jgi:hypothetical protein
LCWHWSPGYSPQAQLLRPRQQHLHLLLPLKPLPCGSAAFSPCSCLGWVGGGLALQELLLRLVPLLVLVLQLLLVHGVPGQSCAS